MQEKYKRLRAQLDELRQRGLPGITKANEKKALGIIDRMLQHGERQMAGLLAPPRFPWAYDGIGTPEELAEVAEKHLNTLAMGKDPWQDKFAEPGGTTIDHALIQKGDEHHLFYIRGRAASHWPQEPSDNFGHGVSRDLVHWEIRPPVLQSPFVGWDEWQVWAPHVIEHDGQFWMFYTGVNRNACQAVGLATSRDLYHWERHGEAPVITPGTWGVWNSTTPSDCRDPQVIEHDGVWYCYYTAHRKKDDGTGEACVGVAKSRNLYDWEDAGYVTLPKSLTTPPESPFMVKKDGRFYLTYTNYTHGICFAISDNPVDGFVEPEGDAGVIVAGVSASEVYETDGQWYMSYISHEPNALHFFEIRELIWNENGTIVLGERPR